MRAGLNFLKSNYRVSLLVLVVFCCLMICLPLMTRAGTVNLEVGIGTNTSTEGISYYIGMVYRFAAAIVGVVAVVMIIIGGIQYSTAAGNNALLGSAKETITSAIIGLVIVLMSYLILGVFSSKFTNLSEPDLEPIKVNATSLPGGRLPESEWCQPGEKAYTDMSACNTACSRYNQICTVRHRSDNQQAVYCCKQTQADNMCSQICEEEKGLCTQRRHCMDIYKNELECRARCFWANTTDPVNCMLDNPSYQGEAPCNALYARVNERCTEKSCGSAAPADKSGVHYICCTQP